ncbi:nucleoside hydrolase [Portibacter marinus]|uniref:nucleoside hydrolase n=1 Tax=Portibacter marinus TaxID=2898660 RepID=UPI001F3FC865|nr:nucleoside hydrolase [Portibacter marinus]
MKKKIWIDSDLAVGKKRVLRNRDGYSDVDDGFAILQLMKSSKVHIQGISAVFGNTIIENAIELCHYMVENFASYEIPVFEGAAQSMDLENLQSNDAVEGLAKALTQDKLTIMAIGPATNVGILLLKYPELASQIEEVVLVAGRRTPKDYFVIGNPGRHAWDLNFDLDNAAFQVMFEHGMDITLCPYEISSKVWIDQDDLNKLGKGDEGCQWLSQSSQAWLQQWLELGAHGFNPFDVLASHYLIQPEDIISENLHARMEIHPNDTIGKNQNTSFKQYLLCDQQKGYLVRYCYDVVENYHEKLMKSLL